MRVSKKTLSSLAKQKWIAQRQDQIIAAARLCFRHHGFHGAGMAEIAIISQLSVGQIYRYFPNKEAIIEEIVHRIVQYRVKLMVDNNNDLDQMAVALSTHGLLDNDAAEIDQALMMEASAEATRNPRIAHILIDVETLLFQQGCDMLQQLYPGMDCGEANVLVELVAVLCEGTMLRILTQQQHQINRYDLQNIYRRILTTVFPASHLRGR